MPITATIEFERETATSCFNGYQDRAQIYYSEPEPSGVWNNSASAGISFEVEIPSEFIEALNDFEQDRVVDLDTALEEPPPSR
jgi:hypothetical protein